MPHPYVARWKIVLVVAAGDLLYLFTVQWLIRIFPSLILAVVPLYLVVPGMLSILVLAIRGLVSLGNGGSRTVSLVLVCIVLPGFVFMAEYATAVLACSYTGHC
jgi:hypothetical protein